MKYEIFFSLKKKRKKQTKNNPQQWSFFLIVFPFSLFHCFKLQLSSPCNFQQLSEKLILSQKINR